MKILKSPDKIEQIPAGKEKEDIKIEYTGLRPGEKLFEELLMDEEGLQDTANKLIHIGKPIEIDEMKFFAQINELKNQSKEECNDIRPLVKAIVPTYVYNQEK